MSEESAFLNAIRANIDDDLPRLVYADWLEERGHAARAEFIRVQCELARTPKHEPRYEILEDREHELLSHHESEFLRPDWPWPHEWYRTPQEWFWRRGFVDEVVMEFGQSLTADYLNRHPIQTLSFVSDFGQLPEFVACHELRPLLTGLRTLILDGFGGLDHHATIDVLSSPYLPNLQGVDFGQSTHHWDACEILRHCPDLCRRLRRLGTSGVVSQGTIGSPLSTRPLSEEVIRSAERAVIRQLQDGLLSMKQIAILDTHSDLLSEWLQAGSTTRTLRLDLRGNTRLGCWKPFATFSSLSWFASSTASDWPRVTELVFDSHSDTIGLGIPCYQHLRHPMFHQLESLTLPYNIASQRFYDILASMDAWRTTLREFCVRSPNGAVNELIPYLHKSSIRELDLRHSRIEDESLLMLGRSPLAEQLTRLRLYDSEYSLEALHEALSAGRWTHLRQLDLANEVLSVARFLPLVRQKQFPRLRQVHFSLSEDDRSDFIEVLEHLRLSVLSLSLPENADMYLEELARMPALRRLNLLLISQNGASDQALIELAESPYLSPICEVDINSMRGRSSRVLDAFRQRLGRRFSF